MNKFFLKMCYIFGFLIFTVGFAANALNHPEISGWPTVVLWILFIIVGLVYLAKSKIKPSVSKASAKQWSYYSWRILIVVSILAFSAVSIFMLKVPLGRSMTLVALYVAAYGIPLVMILYPVTRITDYLSE